MTWPVDMVQESRDNTSMEIIDTRKCRHCRWLLEARVGFRQQLSRDGFGSYPPHWWAVLAQEEQQVQLANGVRKDT